MTAPDPRLSAEITRQAPAMTALRAAFLVAAHHGVTLRAEELPRLTDGDFAPAVMAALDRAGFATRALDRCTWAKLGQLGSALPALVPMADGRWLILVLVVDNAGGPMAAVLDPEHEAEGLRLMPQGEFLAGWSGQVILVAPAQAPGQPGPFGFAWFWPLIRAEAGLLAGVAVAVLVANLISFSLPLLFQTLIDKVITHHAWATLATVVTVLVVLTLFDAGFSYTRQRIMQIVGARIDAQMGAKSFAHMMSLPLSVFETQPAGVLARHLQQAEKIRAFLTGRLFQTLLDAAFLPLLLGLLALLSGRLTAVVLGFACAIALVIAALLPLLRTRLNALYAAEAERQAHLIETLHNMRAVKSLVLEPARRQLWENGLASSLYRQWDVGSLAAAAGAVTGALEKLMQVSVIGFGVALVLEGALSTGALVAFLMLAGRVTGPLVQIVGLINEGQEAALSVRMLASVMDRKPERGLHNRPARHAITGQISFANVRFTWPGGERPALDGLTFDIKPGQVIGVVGRSGSGKTTVTRLITGIEVPQSGLIQIDGVDIRQIDLDHLRRHIGVVLQENLLFRGSIRDNIAMARPNAAPEEVALCAQLAGAEEFIRALPAGFETMVEEGGANLSGGQRQRIAIARALMGGPRVLVFDEATSALDPESELIVNRNLAAIARGRTVIVVSHRLSSLRRADAIMVMDKGRLLDMAPHEVLLTRCDVYRQLWDSQTEHVT